MATLPIGKKKMARATKKEEAVSPEVPNSFSSPESSNIDGAEYHPATGHMTVFFRRGPAYDFAGIPAGIWAGFVTASSKGAYFSSTIRPLYTGVRQPIAAKG